MLQVGSWEWDITSGAVRWSAEMYKILGLREGSGASYDAYFDRIHPVDRERVAGLIADAVSSGVPLEFEHRIVCPDGTVRALQCRGEVVSEDGSAVRLFGICQDVTARQRIQDEIALERELAFSVDATGCLGDALEVVLRRLCEYGDFALGQAWMLAGDAYLEFAAAWPCDSGLAAFTERSKAMTFEQESGLPGRAWAARRPVWVEDVKSDANMLRASFAREVGIAAAMAVPIPSGERVVAVVEFFATETRPPDAAISALVSRVATQLGPMLERKRAEAALRISDERFRLLLESVEDAAIVMLDEDGNVATWNPAAEHVTGYAAEDILGCHVSRLYAPEALAQGEPEGHLQQAAAERRIEHGGWWMRADGLRYRAEVTICALLNGDPDPHGYSYVIRDVTQRSRRDEELRRLRTTVECTEDAIVSVTPERGIVTSWNRGAERLFGYGEREMVGRPVETVFGDPSVAAAAAILSRVRRQQRAEHHDMRGLRKNGSVIDTRLTVAPVRGGGEVTLIARDVTERKRSQQYLERTFGTYLDREIAEHILREGPALRAREVDVTMMFIDIRDFTAFAEQFDPSEVLETLNCLFELVVPIIAERDGHVDKFVGDGLLAVFGAPAHQPDHADLALDAAAAIARAAAERFQGDLEIGIGIDSGKVIAGNVGGGGRLDFTVIGDAVNTAARIETATRETGDVILFSEHTARRLRRDGRQIVARTPVSMKGKRNHVALYALDPEAHPAPQAELTEARS